jgi:hypothetical protein
VATARKIFRKEVNACRASKFVNSRRFHPALAERQN